MGKLHVLKFPSATVNSVMLFILLILSFVIFIFLVSVTRQIIKRKKLKELFFKEAVDLGLSEKEASILWDYSDRFGRDPFLSLEFKAPFEKVVDLYLSTDPDANEKLVTSMRKKLGFDVVPYFVPLTSTKDIEVFQTARIYAPDDSQFDVALFDKDERFMYWAIIDSGRVPTSLKVGDTVKISFVRKNDAMYSFESEVADTVYEGEKLLIKLPHSFELVRRQRREYTRVEAEIPCRLGVWDEGEDVNWYDVSIVDISVGGVKICFPHSRGVELKSGQKVGLKFHLKGKVFSIESEVVNVYIRKTSICYGVKFSDMEENDKRVVFDFVKEQQQRLASSFARKS